MGYEFDEWEAFKLHPLANLQEESQSEPDAFDQFVRRSELERAGGPVLPDRSVRLRSESSDEPLEKFGPSTASGRKKQAIESYIERMKAAGHSVSTIIRTVSEKLEAADPELRRLLTGENE